MLKRLCAAAALVILLAGSSHAETGNAAKAGLTAAVTVPTVEVVDGTMDGDNIRRVLSGDIAGHADELARLRAKSITIPELTVTFAMTGESLTSALVYRDISLVEITDGVAQSVTVGAVETTSSDGTRFNFGKMSTGLFDIPALLRFYGILPGEATGEPKTVYENLAFDGGSLTAKDVTCTLGPISIASVKARPLKTSFDDLFVGASGLAEPNHKPSPAELARYFGFLADFSYAIEFSPMTFGGFDCSGTDDEGKPITVGLGTVNIGAYAKGILPRMAAENLRIVVNDGNLSFGSLVLKSVDLTKTIAMLNAADPATIDEAWLVAHQRELVPELEGWSIADFKMDLPDKNDPATRIHASVAAADMTAKNYVDGIPGEVSLTLSHVAFPLPTDSKNNSVKRFRDLGFDDVDLSFELTAAWDKALQTIKIGRLALGGVDIGSVDADAVLGNVTKSLFSDDKVEQMAAMLVATLDQINIDVEDGGIGQRFDQLAVKQGKEPAAMRRTFSQVAEAGIVAALGGTPDAAELGAAVAAFVGGTARSLSVSIRSRDGNSLSIAEWSHLAEDPQSLGDRLSIDATAK